MKGIKLGQYIIGNSIIHQLDPRTKLIGCFVIILSVLMNARWPVYVFNILLILTIIYLAKIKISKIIHGLKTLRLLFLFTFIFQAILTRGVLLVSLGPINFTKEGIVLGFTTLLRLLLLYLCSTLLTTTTSPIKLAAGIESLCSPLCYLKVPVHQFAMLINASLRFIPTIMEESEMIIRAQKSRGAQFHSPKVTVRLKTMLTVLILLLALSLQRASDLAIAMESRCYTGGPNYSRMKKLCFSEKDRIAMIIIAVIFILQGFLL